MANTNLRFVIRGPQGQLVAKPHIVQIFDLYLPPRIKFVQRIRTNLFLTPLWGGVRLRFIIRRIGVKFVRRRTNFYLTTYLERKLRVPLLPHPNFFIITPEKASNFATKMGKTKKIGGDYKSSPEGAGGFATKICNTHRTNLFDAQRGS